MRICAQIAQLISAFVLTTHLISALHTNRLLSRRPDTNRLFIKRFLALHSATSMLHTLS